MKPISNSGCFSNGSFHRAQVVLFIFGMVSVGLFSWTPAGAEPYVRVGDPRLAEALSFPGHEADAIKGRYLVLSTDRDFARPQDRWVTLVLDVAALPEERSAYHLSARLTGGDDGARLRFVPESDLILLQVDMRRLEVSETWLEIEAEREGRRVDGVALRLRSEEPSRPLRPREQIPVKVDFPPGTDAAGPAPVVVGVPFAPGQLWDVERLSLQTSEGQPVSFQREATGTWIDGGSIQWAQLRAVVESGHELVVVVDADSSGEEDLAPLVTQEQPGQWILRAGPNHLVVEAGPSPVRAVFADDVLVADGAGVRGLYLIDSKGRLAQSSPDADINIESSGPVSASIRIEADYVTESGEAVARHITRLESHVGKSGVEITHTLIFTRDTNELWFREAGWEWAVPDGNRDGMEAVFAVDNENFGLIWEEPLQEPGAGAFLFQESYPSIGGGSARFHGGLLEGSQEQVVEGDAMGDWAGYHSGGGGCFWSVKDAARQHPKEFLITRETMNLLFFSSRGGEEIDFRTETLEERWGVGEELDGEQLEKFREHVSNAAGWSKTHELLLIPASAGVDLKRIAAEAERLRFPVYAMVAPAWIYQSGAMGPLYPYDPDRFPDAEALMEVVFDRYAARVPGERYNGFFDYYAGPHYGHSGRYRLTYSLLHDAWLYAARTGDRRARQFAEGANRAFRDNYINHWETPVKKQGLFVSATGGTGGWRKSDFPFYWEEQSNFALATTTSLMQFIWDYQIAGNRRSGEVARGFADALVENWDSGDRVWRVFMVLRVLAQAWQFTNQPELLVLLEETANQSVYDPEGELLMTQDRPYGSSTYKTNTDVGTMIQLWELLGTRRWEEMARRTADYWWRKRAGHTPLFRISGRYLNFLWHQTGSPAIAQTIDYNLRQTNTALDPRTGQARGLAFSTLDNIFQGLPYGMDVVVRTGADREPVASIIDYDDYGNRSAWFLKKGGNQRVVLHAQPPESPGAGVLHPRLRVEALDPRQVFELDLIRMDQMAGTSLINLTFTKDAPGLVYQLTPEMSGAQYAVADSMAPMVFWCDGYWRPATGRPAYRYYFQVPEGESGGRFFSEGSTRFYQPDGTPWREGEALEGWAELPIDTPGLWAFEPVETGLVRLDGVAPVFAMNSAEAWFDPGDVVEELQAPGRKRRAGTPSREEAVFIGDGQGLEIANGDPADALFDHREGVIEFFFKPDWSTFDLRDGTQPVSREILRVETEQSPWVLTYRIDPTGSNINMGPREPSHSFYAQFDTFDGDDPQSHRQLRAWNTHQILEDGQWVHVALVWGPEEKIGARERYEATGLRVYVNGVGQGVSLQQGRERNVPAGPVKALRFSPRLEGSIRHLRISDSRRYTENFPPADPSAGLAKDDETRLWLPLEGTLESSDKVTITQ